MASRADERSRVLGGVVVVLALLAGTLFLAGIFARSYVALAIPVAAGFLFVLGLVVWIGWTIATVQAPASGEPLPSQNSTNASGGEAQTSENR